MDRTLNFCLLSIKTPLFVESAVMKARRKQEDNKMNSTLSISHREGAAILT